MRMAVVMLLALITLTGLALGEQFAERSRKVSVTRYEDTPGLGVLDKKLECQAFAPMYYIGNEEPIPFEVIPDVWPHFFVDVRFTRPPDAELGDELFDVLVVCDDGDPSPPPATATVTVTILSVNEYTPFAAQESYSIAFSETVLEGEVVGSAGAGPNQYLIVDEDGGLDGKITYTALDNPPNPYFSLDPETGNITLQNELDYERNGSLTSSLLIHGCDRSSPPALCPNITIHFTLTAANDNDPYFLQTDYSVLVKEGLHRGTALMTNISCRDADIGIGAYAGIEITSSTLHLVEVTDTQLGTATLLLTAVLDYDFTNDTEFEVMLRCYDSGEGGAVRSGAATVHITVAPDNDHAPQFTAAWYNTSVLESLPVGSHLFHVQCSDQDRGYGGLTGIQLYQPSLAVNSTFLMNSATGQLTLIGPLDYDDPTTQSHVFTIYCYDDGGLEVFSRISISTLPVSDEPLTFKIPGDGDEFEFTVDRLTALHSRIGQVVVVDGDRGEVPIIAYTIENNDLFDIDDEGYLVLTDYLCRDKGDHFNLTVEARDGQGVVSTQVLVSATGGLCFLNVINVAIGVFGLIIIAIIGVLVALCSYFCWKLYRSYPEENMSEVPVFMRGDNLPPRPPSGISRSSSGKRHHVHRSSTLREKSTLSMQRNKMKKKQQNFKKRARQRPGIRESFFMGDSSRVDMEDEQVLFGQNPDETEMTLFSNEKDMNGSDTEAEWREGEEEAVDSTHNIFNPEDAGLLLGDIMLFPGEEQTRWYQDDGDNKSLVDVGSWALLDEEQSGSSVADSDGGGSAEWDPSASVEYDLDKQDTHSLTLTHI